VEKGCQAVGHCLQCLGVKQTAATSLCGMQQEAEDGRRGQVVLVASFPEASWEGLEPLNEEWADGRRERDKEGQDWRRRVVDLEAHEKREHRPCRPDPPSAGTLTKHSLATNSFPSRRVAESPAVRNRCSMKATPMVLGMDPSTCAFGDGRCNRDTPGAWVSKDHTRGNNAA
jgi:hypothetical protein